MHPAKRFRILTSRQHGLLPMDSSQKYPLWLLQPSFLSVVLLQIFPLLASKFLDWIFLFATASSQSSLMEKFATGLTAPRSQRI